MARVEDPLKARICLGGIVQDITIFVEPSKEASTNLAFTWTGLRDLGLSDRALQTFSLPFREGMSTLHRSRILGDTEENASSNWEWGSGDTGRVDVLLLIYASDEVQLQSQINLRREQLFGSGAFEETALLSAGRQPDAREHFGFN